MAEWIISSSILICVIAGLRFVFQGKIRPTLQYMLWGLVLVRLLCPFSLGRTQYSVANFVPNAESQQAPVQKPEPAKQDGILQTGTENLPVGTEPGKEQTAFHAAWSAKQILKTIWIIGMVAVGSFWLISDAVLHFRLSHARRQIGHHGSVPIYQTSVIASPCLFGMVKPAIYVTDEVMESKKLLRHSIVHEAMHYHHGDHVWSVLRCVCLIIHWYNPLVWWAAGLSRRDAEFACDEAAIRRLGEQERGDYGRTLIQMTCMKKEGLLRTAATMAAGKKGVKERIMMIAKKPKTAAAALVLVTAISAAAVGCTFTGSEQPTVPSETIGGNTASESTESSTAVHAGPTQPSESKPVSTTATEPVIEPTHSSTEKEETHEESSAHTEENQSPAETSAPVDESMELSADSFPGVPDKFLNVLTGKDTFYNCSSQESESLQEFYSDFEQISELKFSPDKYALADLDQDGTEEFILWLGNDSMDYGTEVFTIHGSEIWGYTFSYRQLMNLKTDGSFSYSGGAADNGTAFLKFEKDGFRYQNIFRSEMSDNGTVLYFAGEKEITEEEYNASAAKQAEKGGITWYTKK